MLDFDEMDGDQRDIQQSWRQVVDLKYRSSPTWLLDRSKAATRRIPTRETNKLYLDNRRMRETILVTKDSSIGNLRPTIC